MRLYWKAKLVLKGAFELSNIGNSITRVSGGLQPNPALCEMPGVFTGGAPASDMAVNGHPEDIEPTQPVKIDSRPSAEKNSTRFIKRYLHKKVP